MCSLGQFLDLSAEFLGSGLLALRQLKNCREPEHQTHTLSAYRLARPSSSLLRQAQALTPMLWTAHQQQAER